MALLPPPQGTFRPYSKPIICAINGPVEGGGCEMSLGCDFRFISRDCFMAQPEVYPGFHQEAEEPNVSQTPWIGQGSRIVSNRT